MTTRIVAVSASKFPPGTVFHCSGCGYRKANLRAVRAHTLNCKVKGSTVIVENIPGASLLVPDAQPPASEEQPSVEAPENEDEDAGGGGSGDDEGGGDGGDGGEAYAGGGTVVEPGPPTHKPQTATRPAIETKLVGQRRQVTEYLDAPIRSVIQLQLLPSTLAIMERCLSDPDEFDFLDERTPSGFFDAVTEMAMLTLDPDYSYRLTLVKEPRATVAEAS